MAWLINYVFYESSNTGVVKAQVQTSWEIRGLDGTLFGTKKCSRVRPWPAGTAGAGQLKGLDRKLQQACQSATPPLDV
jgi:hypothetical protein